MTFAMNRRSLLGTTGSMLLAGGVATRPLAAALEHFRFRNDRAWHEVLAAADLLRRLWWRPDSIGQY
jgi:hypothetical protein